MNETQHASSENFSLTDKMGIFIGTIIFLLIMPLTLLISSLPIAILKNIISNSVIIMFGGFFLMLIGGAVSLVMSLIFGIIISYTMNKIDKFINVSEFFFRLVRNDRPFQNSSFSNTGALIGGALSMIGLIIKGGEPIHTVTAKIEHLFPAPLILSLGDIVTLNFAHGYAVATGFLTIGLLFLIAGVASGSITGIIFDRLSHKKHE
ncbi:MAG: hypothetical protein A2504_13645 [Bdellovibrionales bacterium RIFOXYD12_FULL_39_22]|nr:MAG: hypothetical protein A2385_00370 [Bdellovibrionales bacterium RIFOXYB1_FULL_39_21]OFZ43868.1 MAG: hypothetical protein A2485_05160 [Bdellovibrionales bacterium RIFOXYC12_FULL_39_17]OFZ48798.1 MAG: hypothetical protein A2404_17685 [Bdellovibrionales bacterium RIFOXYC1_FULL_39_130]OFZ76531.1 MAG: hypothetical protein A2560_06350 [Bdellovibrionales bacterium RIFOXYD1_FULL_39_84]OFZ94765.1 MAG: hypothetical protein A2504_13645 [Bdellovibrionales bacterium RIFOXYD12_FULL_39_22]HLE12188.1 hy